MSLYFSFVWLHFLSVQGGAECLLVPAQIFMALATVSKPFGVSTAALVREMVSLFRTSEILVKEIENIVLTGIFAPYL